jgi:ribosomal silencing factor RsfS
MAKSERGGDLGRWALIALGVVVFTVKANQARQVYLEEVSSGSKPIEGVGTAVAAFIGLLPGGPVSRG